MTTPHTSVLTQQFLAKQYGCHPPATVHPWFGTLCFFLSPKTKLKLKGRRFDTRTIEEIQAESQKRTSRKRYKNGEDGGTGVYMREGTTSRVMATDRPYSEFYDFYSVRPKYFGYTLVFAWKTKPCQFQNERYFTFNITSSPQMAL
jgi:hypothetical protein